MKEELIKLTRSEEPEKNFNKNRYLIKCIGYGMAAHEWLKEKFWQHLDNLDIVLLSYFGDTSYHGSEEDLANTFFEVRSNTITDLPSAFNFFPRI